MACVRLVLFSKNKVLTIRVRSFLSLPRFVTLKTTSRDEMVDIMFELRQKKFESGEPVMARLKSGVAVNRDAATNVVYFGSDMMMKQAAQTTSNRQNNNGGRKNKKKI